MTTKHTRIGSGAGFSGDRFEPAVELAERGELADLVLECLAERTIALGHQRRLADADQGYDDRLVARLRPLLPAAATHGVRVISNMGSANPMAAGRRTCDLLDELGLAGKVAVVTGDDVLGRVDLDAPALEDGRPLAEHGEVISANAYLGAESVLPALDIVGADVVLTGRVADPSLFLAPLAHRMNWDSEDWQRIAAGTMVGHLLECAGQVTGGYFADPGTKDVGDLANLGFPWADVAADGTATIGKLPGSGGQVSRATVREQLLYEITDPTGYETPDVVLDLRRVGVTQTQPDRVRVTGALGRPRPERLKVSVGYHAGHRAEAEISYVGPNAEQRARLAGEIVANRLQGTGLAIRIDVIGTFSSSPWSDEALESRLRIAALTEHRELAELVCHEVESLYTNGPAGGGGVRMQTTPVLGIVSTSIPRDEVSPAVTVLEASHARDVA